MKPIKTIAIFDIGKTNKKFLLFDQELNIVFEKSEKLEETRDEDGDPCEDLGLLHGFVFDSLEEASAMKEFEIVSVNFSAYGASLVYVDEKGIPVAPLYNYLKKYPASLSDGLYKKYGGIDNFSLETASPALGSLNSGLQLYRIKKKNPALFNKIKYAIHLPQYLSQLITKKFYSDLTSIGCHTAMWDFKKNDYHDWMRYEGLIEKLPRIVSSNEIFKVKWKNKEIECGVGLHDSSAALVPHLLNNSESFILISTGTWNISLNPFDKSNLTAAALAKDCLCYLSFNGKKVKASRFFAGPVYDSIDRKDYLEGMRRLVDLQAESTNLVLQDQKIEKIIVDGGFSRNAVFMKLLEEKYPSHQVVAASVTHASALGAAMMMRSKNAINTKAIIRQ